MTGLAVLAESQGARGIPDEAREGALAEAIRLLETMGARYDPDKAVKVRDRLASTPADGGPSRDTALSTE